MTNIHQINDVIVTQATKVCSRIEFPILFEAQFSYWSAAKDLMNQGGYALLQKRMQGFSEPLAMQIAKTPLHNLIALSNEVICPFKHIYSDKTIKDLLRQPDNKDVQYTAMLQLLAQRATNDKKYC